MKTELQIVHAFRVKPHGASSGAHRQRGGVVQHQSTGQKRWTCNCQHLFDDRIVLEDDVNPTSLPNSISGRCSDHHTKGLERFSLVRCPVPDGDCIAAPGCGLCERAAQQQGRNERSLHCGGGTKRKTFGRAHKLRWQERKPLTQAVGTYPQNGSMLHSSQAKLRSTNHRLTMTANLCGSLRLATFTVTCSSSASRTPCANGLPV